MAGIIDFSQVVLEALADFGDLWPNEPQRRHFAEYLTGLFVADMWAIDHVTNPYWNAERPVAPLGLT